MAVITDPRLYSVDRPFYHIVDHQIVPLRNG